MSESVSLIKSIKDNFGAFNCPANKKENNKQERNVYEQAAQNLANKYLGAPRPFPTKTPGNICQAVPLHQLDVVLRASRHKSEGKP